VRQRGKETYKLKLTNKNYKYYSGLESGKLVVGPVSAQALVNVWVPGKTSVEMKSKVFNMVLLRDLHTIYMDWWPYIYDHIIKLWRLQA
jgi:hypothetical protein